MRNRLTLLLAGAAGVALAMAAPAAAQASGDSVLVYEREVFKYTRAGRPDPFRSLLSESDLGVRFEDLALLGVMYHPEPARSVAIISQQGVTRRMQGKVGDRFGGMRIIAIRPRSIDLVIEEFGVARRETLELLTAQEKGNAP